MPTYVYRCPQCQTEFEFQHGMREKPQVPCPNCGTISEHVFVPSGVVFKGSGFFNTDYRNDKGTHDESPAPCEHCSDCACDQG
ncbi:MAG: FmdB family zinc ribbon protein [Coriobacteriales bacterium]|nr:FmdB family zinc ribbon protein [Coriobacteriales bacterium]